MYWWTFPVHNSLSWQLFIYSDHLQLFLVFLPSLPKRMCQCCLEDKLTYLGSVDCLCRDFNRILKMFLATTSLPYDIHDTNYPRYRDGAHVCASGIYTQNRFPRNVAPIIANNNKKRSPLELYYLELIFSEKPFYYMTISHDANNSERHR